MSKKVIFIAKTKAKEPRVVTFNTKEGRVSFIAKKTIERPRVVSFEVKRKERRK